MTIKGARYINFNLYMKCKLMVKVNKNISHENPRLCTKSLTNDLLRYWCIENKLKHYQMTYRILEP